MKEAREHRPEPVRPRMSRQNRAKQFAPFAALGSLDGLRREAEELHPIPEWEHLPDEEFLRTNENDWI